ncbi:hypothetical protein GVK97_15095 [Enterococcus hirae]|nr:hypothetical protein [Enterococcus hirae]
MFTTKLFANNLKKLLFRVALNGCHHNLLRKWCLIV